MSGRSRNPLVPFRGFDIVGKGATAQDGRSGVLKVSPEVRNREMYPSCSLLQIRTGAHSHYRSDCNQANLARDGLSVQGHQAFLTTISREVDLIYNQVVAVVNGELKGYKVHVDYNRIAEAIWMEEDDKGDDEHRTVIHPEPWKYAPATDGSTAQFEKDLKECRDFMEDFAMHTPYYFIRAVNSGRDRYARADGVSDGEDEDEDSAANKASGAVVTSKKSASEGSTGTEGSRNVKSRRPKEATRTGGRNQGKRKDREEGACSE